MILPKTYHMPVLLPQVIDGLRIRKGGKYIDATLGGGGYTEVILKIGGIVLGLDADTDAIKYVKNKFGNKNSEFKINKDIFLTHGNFSEIKEIAKKYGFRSIDGIVFDLGMSNYQITDSGRGFSYQRDEPLDMRMDKNKKLRAEEIINDYSKSQLYEIFTKNAEEIYSGAIVSAIIRSRSVNGRIKSTRHLGEIIGQAVLRELNGVQNQNNLHVINRCKARIFQALRIAVNDELNNLQIALTDSLSMLASGGRLAVLSYHSLEDRTVKTIFKKNIRSGNIKLIEKKPITADWNEQNNNPKSKSAKLRIGEKIAV